MLPVYENLPLSRFRNSLNEVKNNLEVLDLSGNCLTTVPLNLRNAFKLTHLDLSENNIKELPQLSFTNLVALKELRINSNEIPALSILAFVNIPALTQFYAKNNKLSKVDPNFFQSFQELEIVDLSNNEIINVCLSLKFVYYFHISGSFLQKHV